MQMRILVVTDADPRNSTRTAEAVRLTAGVGAWDKVAVDLYLHGAAVLCLDEYADELPDGNVFEQYLPTIAAHGGKIYVQAESEHLVEVRSTVEAERVAGGQLKKLLADVRYTLRLS